jgi:hypothetical protein
VKYVLQAGSTATTVRLDAGRDPVVTAGPFVEGKEVVSGYTEVEVDDLDQVLKMASTWPGCPVVEIRPIMEMSPAERAVLRRRMDWGGGAG